MTQETNEDDFSPTAYRMSIGEYRDHVNYLLDRLEQSNNEYTFLTGEVSSALGISNDPNANVTSVNSTSHFPLDQLGDNPFDEIENAKKDFYGTLLFEESEEIQ